MRVLYWILKIYWVVILVWVLSTWIGFPAPLTKVLSWLTYPIWRPLGWLHIGQLWIGPMAMLLLLWALERWVGKQAGIHDKQPVEHTSPSGEEE